MVGNHKMCKKQWQEMQWPHFCLDFTVIFVILHAVFTLFKRWVETNLSTHFHMEAAMRKLLLAMVLAVVWLVHPVIADDLVLYLSFDNDSGNAAIDLSAFGNHATFFGNPQWVAGKHGQGLEFDGSTWGEVGDDPSLDLTSALTVEAWALVEPGGEAIQSAVEKGNAWKEGEYNLAALYNGGSILQARDLPVDCADTNIGSSIQDGTWHFLAGTWDGSVIRLYIDGALDAEMPCSGTLLTNDDPLYIGARGGTGRFLIGALDELKVYDYALTQDEIQLDMDAPGRNTTAVDAVGKLASTWGAIKREF